MLDEKIQEELEAEVRKHRPAVKGGCAISIAFYNKKKREYRHPNRKHIPYGWEGRVKAIYWLALPEVRTAPVGSLAHVYVLRVCFFQVTSQYVTFLGWHDTQDPNIGLEDCYYREDV